MSLHQILLRGFSAWEAIAAADAAKAISRVEPLLRPP